MSQNDFVIANQSAPDFRSDLSNALQALATLSSGATAPATTYSNMLWYDTANNILKMRSEADDAWISIGYLDQTANAFRVLDDTQVVNTSGTQTGLLGDQSTATWEAGTGTTESLVSPAKVKAGFDAFEQQLGVGQTWQDVTASRSSGTTYTNSTGKPISVHVSSSSSAGSTDVDVFVGGVKIIDYSVSGGRGTASFTVPNAETYRVVLNTSLTLWAELR
jgi:hypothetical protein